MRPLRPFWGTVLKAQLLTLPATISTSANGVVTTQLSFLPPASSSATEVCGSSDSRPATAQPPEPPPTTTKSYVPVTCISPQFFLCVIPGSIRRTRTRRCSQAVYPPLLSENSAFAPFMARPVPWGVFAAILSSQKPQNGSIGPFQSGCTLIHTPRTRWLCLGCLLRKPPVGTIDAQSVGR